MSERTLAPVAQFSEVAVFGRGEGARNAAQAKGRQGGKLTKRAQSTPVAAGSSEFRGNLMHAGDFPIDVLVCTASHRA